MCYNYSGKACTGRHGKKGASLRDVPASDQRPGFNACHTAFTGCKEKKKGGMENAWG